MHRHAPVGRVRALLVAVALGAAALVAATPNAPAAPAPHGSRPVGFGIQSATKGKPDARGYLTYSATPGARVDDQVAVLDLGPKPLSLTVYAVDATTGEDGSFALAPHAAKASDVGTWIATGGTRTVQVPARTSAGPSYVIVPFRLSIPPNASPGDHAGGVVVALTTRVKNDQGVQVNLEQRVGLRVYIRVSGDIKPGLAIDDLSVRYRGPGLLDNPVGDGVATVRYFVRNTGNVLLGATQSAEVSSWLGGTVHLKGLPIIPPLLPGARVEVSRTVHGVFPGLRVTASVHLKPAAPPGAADPALEQVSASASVWAVPWTLLALVLALLCGAVLLVWSRLRSHQPAPRAAAHRAPARSGAAR